MNKVIVANLNSVSCVFALCQMLCSGFAVAAMLSLQLPSWFAVMKQKNMMQGLIKETELIHFLKLFLLIAKSILNSFFKSYIAQISSIIWNLNGFNYVFVSLSSFIDLEMMSWTCLLHTDSFVELLR